MTFSQESLLLGLIRDLHLAQGNRRQRQYKQVYSDLKAFCDDVGLNIDNFASPIMRL